MANVIFRPAQPGFGTKLGTALGEGLGTGLSSGLKQLAQSRIQEKLRTRQKEAFDARDIGTLYGLLDPAGQSKLAQGLQQQQQAQQQEQQQATMEQALADILAPGAQQVPGVQQDQQLAQAPVSPEQIPSAPPAVAKAAVKLTPGSKSEQLQSKMDQKFAKPGLSARQRIKIQESVEKKQADLLKQQDVIDKKTQKTFDKLSDEGSAADTDLLRLDRMTDLIESGELNNPLLSRIIQSFEHKPESFKIPFLGPLSNAVGNILRSSFITPSTEEFEKLTSDFIKGAKVIFGSRLTDADLKAFLKTVPTIGQSDEAKLRVIRNLRVFYQGAQARKKAMNEVIEEHGGFRPSNIKNLTEKRAKPELDRIAKQIKRDVPRSAAELRAIRQTEEAMISPMLQAESQKLGVPTPKFRRRT